MGDELTLEEKTRKAAEFIRNLEDGTPMILMAEPDNPKDMEAIAVYMDYTRKVILIYLLLEDMVRGDSL